MSLIVEDGTGKPDAESYISVSDAADYLAKRGNKTFAEADTSDQEAALRNATEFMLSVYRVRWAGFRYGLTQALDWPRSYVPIPDVAVLGGYIGSAAFVAYNSVPTLVQQACADLAVRALLGPLVPDVGRLKKSVKLGPLSVEYQPYGSASTTFVAVTAKLSPYLVGGGGMTSLVRT